MYVLLYSIGTMHLMLTHDVLADVQQSSYWLTWFSTRGFSTVLDLAAIISLLWTWMRTKVFGRTPRQIREWTKPQPYDFPCQIANWSILPPCNAPSDVLMVSSAVCS